MEEAAGTVVCPARRWAVVLLLLLVLAILRLTNLGLQDAYLDEGCHIHRAVSAWSLTGNPASSAHGKLLLYYWLGLFVSPTQGPGMLVVARTAVAGFAIITGLAIYLLGRRLVDHTVGAVALALYAVLPLSLFYDRMALADPLASGLSVLSVLAAATLVERPNLLRAGGTGLLLGLAAMAKLSLAPLVLLPAIMAHTRCSREHDTPTRVWRHFFRDFTLPLLVMLGAATAVWLPFLAPAALAGDGTAVVLYHPDNVRFAAGEGSSPSPWRAFEYLRDLLPLVADFTTWGFLGLFAGALVLGCVPRFLTPAARRAFELLLQWLVVITLPLATWAALITSRYAVVLVAPVCLIVALILVALWNRLPSWPVRGAVTALAVTWVVGHAAPFAATTLTAPWRLPFTGTNRVEHLDGFFLSDEAVRSAAAMLNEISPEHTAATWKIFHLMFFYLDSEPTLLRWDHPAGDLRRELAALPDGCWLYLAFSDYPTFYREWGDIQFEEIAVFERPRISRPVRLVRLRPAER